MISIKINHPTRHVQSGKSTQSTCRRPSGVHKLAEQPNRLTANLSISSAAIIFIFITSLQTSVNSVRYQMSPISPPKSRSDSTVEKKLEGGEGINQEPITITKQWQGGTNTWSTRSLYLDRSDKIKSISIWRRRRPPSFPLKPVPVSVTLL